MCIGKDQAEFVEKSWEASCRIQSGASRIVDKAIDITDEKGIPDFPDLCGILSTDFEKLLRLYKRNASDSMETIPFQVEVIGARILQLLVRTEMIGFDAPPTQFGKDSYEGPASG